MEIKNSRISYQKKVPFFSIVIPTYNRASDLQFALYCILRQTFADFEVIISDNCSTDNTRDVINSFKDKRIRYFVNKKNIGVIPNIKKAIRYVKGEYVFLHSDDDFLFDENALKEIFQKINKYNPGYIRVNYVCLTPDKKWIFDFKINKRLTEDKFLSSFSKNTEILAFINDSDSYFITGIIFKNKLTSDIAIIDCEPMSWIKILFYVTKNFGAYFISRPYIIASWSQWRIRESGHYQQYAVIDGKLESEGYFNAVKEVVGKEEYKTFLHNEIKKMYILMFPVIKIYIGNKKMYILAAKLRILDSKIAKTVTFWVYLFFALVLPKFFLIIIKNIYLYTYTRRTKVKNVQIITKLRKVNQEYSYY